MNEENEALSQIYNGERYSVSTAFSGNCGYSLMLNQNLTKGRLSCFDFFLFSIASDLTSCFSNKKFRKIKNVCSRWKFKLRNKRAQVSWFQFWGAGSTSFHICLIKGLRTPLGVEATKFRRVSHEELYLTHKWSFKKKLVAL